MAPWWERPFKSKRHKPRDIVKTKDWCKHDDPIEKDADCPDCDTPFWKPHKGK